MINMTVCFLLGNRTFQLIPRVSYTHTTFRIAPRVSHIHTEILDIFVGLLPYINFGYLHGSLTLIQDLSPVMTPFLLRPTHLNSTSLYDLSHESFIGRRPKHELITRSLRMVNNHTVHSHPTRRDVTVHMNAMMPIHISNSNGSYTIIFHIIQTIMLRHQLACFNISFPIHISSHSIQVITCKENTWKNFQFNHQSGLLTVP